LFLVRLCYLEGSINFCVASDIEHITHPLRHVRTLRCSRSAVGIAFATDGAQQQSSMSTSGERAGASECVVIVAAQLADGLLNASRREAELQVEWGRGR
jgi:hypothetical protein